MLVLNEAPAGVRGVLVEQLQVAVAGVGVAVAAAGEVHPELEAVRARDRGQRAPVRPAARVVVVLTVGLGAVAQVEQAVVGRNLAVPGVAAQGRRKLGRVPGRADRREARGLEARREGGGVGPRLEDARAVSPRLVVVRVPVQVRQREAELGEHPVARRAGPLRGSRVVVRRGPRRRRRRQVDVRAALAEPALSRLVEHRRELVPRRHPPRQPRVRAGHGAPVDAEAGGVPPRRHEELQPVADHGTAERAVDVGQRVHPGRPSDAQALEPTVQVVGAARRAADEEVPAEPVAALVGNHVDAQAAGLRLGPVSRRGVRRLGREQRVDVGLIATVADHRVDGQPVDLHRGVGGVEAAAHHLRLLRSGGAAHVRLVHLDARNQQGVRPQAAPGRHGLLHLAGHHHAAPGPPRVDPGRRDRQRGVDRQGRAVREDDPVAPHGIESRQREGDGVFARPQVGDRVAPGAVGDGAPPLDEAAARRLDGCTGQHPAGVVGHNTRDRALRRRGSGRQQHAREHQPLVHLLTSRLAPGLRTAAGRWVDRHGNGRTR